MASVAFLRRERLYRLALRRPFHREGVPDLECHCLDGPATSRISPSASARDTKRAITAGVRAVAEWLQGCPSPWPAVLISIPG